MITAWLIERGQPEGYSSPLYWEGSLNTFSADPNAAIRFARKWDAERVIASLVMLPAHAAEHAWVGDQIGEVRYGDDGTIHRTGHVDVEVDHYGLPVSVWFRCHPVPFESAVVGEDRAEEMRRMYAKNDFPPVKAIVFDKAT